MMSSLAFTVNIPLGKQSLWSTKGNKDVFANWWNKYFRVIVFSTAGGKQRTTPFIKVILKKKIALLLLWQLHTSTRLGSCTKMALSILAKNEESCCPQNGHQRCWGSGIRQGSVQLAQYELDTPTAAVLWSFTCNGEDHSLWQLFTINFKEFLSYKTSKRKGK